MNGSSDPMRLDRLNGFPDGLAEIGPRDIRRVLPNPTLISVPGRTGAPLFVSTMLHGNETTSFYVLQALAAKFAHETPHRPLLIFVGGVRAAEAGLRIAPGGTDFNRVWAGGDYEGGDSAEAAIAAEVLATIKAAQPFASIDIHNTTGANPCYACIARLDAGHLGLASLFSRIIVQYENPPTTQSVAFSKFCTAATIECGRPGDSAGIERATAFVLDALRVDALEPLAPKPGDVAIYKTAGRIELDEAVTLSFGGRADVMFQADFDRLNFTELPPGEVFARLATQETALRVYDETRRDLTDKFFVRDGDYLRLARAATPAMLTTQPLIVRQDCVGYLMQRVDGAPDKD